MGQEQYTNIYSYHILLNVRWCGVSDDTCSQSSILRKIQQLWGDTPTFWRWTTKHIHVIQSDQYSVCTHVLSL